MKKNTLFFAALMACMMSFAQTPERVLDLSKCKEWGFPAGKDYVNKADTFAIGIDSLIFTPSGNAKEGIKVALDYDNNKDTAGIVFGKSGAMLTLSAYPFEIEKIVVYGISSASGNVTLNLFAGENAVSTEVKSSKQTQTFLVDKGAQYANAKYSIKVTNANNAQISKIEIYKKTNEPSISCDAIAMGNVGNGVFNTKVFDVLGSNLTDVVVPTMKDGKNFSVAGTLTVEGGQVAITVTALTSGEYKDVLVLTSGKIVKEVEVSANVNVLSGKGTKESPLSVADLQIINNPTDTAWVVGYIVGSIKDNKVENTPSQPTNIALSDTKTLAENAVFAPVQLPKGDIRTALNVVDNKENIGKKVKVQGALEAYFLKPGIKGVKAYEFVSPSTAVEEVKAEAGKAVKVVENGQLVIIRDGVRYNAVGAVIE